MTAETYKYVAELTRIYRTLTKKCKFLKLMIAFLLIGIYNVDNYFNNMEAEL